ncbi:MAG: hypothetical protein ABWX97_02900 [Domibacillus tundrae]
MDRFEKEFAKKDHRMTTPDWKTSSLLLYKNKRKRKTSLQQADRRMNAWILANSVFGPVHGK